MADLVSLTPKRFAIEKFIHQENLALFRKRLAESHNDAERKVLLKLLADEEAKDLPQGQEPRKELPRKELPQARGN